jgi:isocitrate dehydrogenase
MTAKIIYTLTDEAPALATYSLLPLVQAFTKAASIVVETRDISLAGRILANFPEALTAAQRQKDDLAELGELAKTPEANIIKLPNISASLPQLQAAIKELQSQGYKVPDYPEAPKDEAEKQAKAKYAKVLGSAVNPVLREGNSDRRVANAVKQYAKKHPHSMGAWSSGSVTRVAHMSEGDFYGNEQSAAIAKAGTLRIEHTDDAGKTTVLKDGIKVKDGELISATFMRREALRKFYEDTIAAAKASGTLLSLHLKATMMKVSDPILFGHAVSVFFKDVFTKHAAVLKQLGVTGNNGIGELYAKLQSLPADQKAQIEADLKAAYAARPPLAMVDSDKGITNLHVPSDVIIDASMPAAIRASGRMWGPDGKLHDMVAMIPDRCYAGVYQAVIEDCKKSGAYDVPTMGNVSNVGLMAQAAEEYGSHDKTFEIGVAHDADERCRDQGLGEARREPRACHRPDRDFLARRRARVRSQSHRPHAAVPERARYQGDGHPHPLAGEGNARHARARARGPGHDFRHGERAARLPHRPVSDPGAGHQREDALDRSAARGRWNVRDGRGRFGAEARSAVRGRGASAMGFAWRVPCVAGFH